MTPQTEGELLSRAQALAGRRILDLPVADADGGHGARHKGGIGTRVERALGVAPGAGAGPDLPLLGIELKTLPVQDGRVLESTWVASATPATLQREQWADSLVRRKLSRVLFIPVEAGRVSAPLRRVGTAFLWSPDAAQEALLRADWEDLSDLVSQTLGFAVSARRGRVLQLRPKARNASVRVRATDADGHAVAIAPQGFYLRRAFTQAIVDQRFGGVQ